MRSLILVDHGSRRPEAGRVLRQMLELLLRRLPPDTEVRGAHMELSAPSLAEAIDASVAAGAAEVIVVPFMLAPGRHVLEDVPRLAAEAARRHPGLSLRVTPCLGAHPALAQVVLERAGLDEDS
ncbi:MAG: cobalamin biosynthesis protein CbiX [Deltaproteobacteria bacterium]|nr:cobalamin biosynthesis protein CbiX [Deltaproteobacteria bacterium]